MRSDVVVYNPFDALVNALEGNNEAEFKAILASNECTFQTLMDKDSNNDYCNILAIAIKNNQVKFVKTILASEKCTSEVLLQANSDYGALLLAVWHESAECITAILNSDKYVPHLTEETIRCGGNAIDTAFKSGNLDCFLPFLVSDKISIYKICDINGFHRSRNANLQKIVQAFVRNPIEFLIEHNYSNEVIIKKFNILGLKESYIAGAIIAATKASRYDLVIDLINNQPGNIAYIDYLEDRSVRNAIRDCYDKTERWQNEEFKNNIKQKISACKTLTWSEICEQHKVIGPVYKFGRNHKLLSAFVITASISAAIILAPAILSMCSQLIMPTLNAIGNAVPVLSTIGCGITYVASAVSHITNMVVTLPLSLLRSIPIISVAAEKLVELTGIELSASICNGAVASAVIAIKDKCQPLWADRSSQLLQDYEPHQGR